MVRLYHGTLVANVPKILKSGIRETEGTGGAGTSGTFLSGTPDGALYWAKMSYQEENNEKLEISRFDRDHGRNSDQLIAVLSIEIPSNETERLAADEEQFEDVAAEIDSNDWKRSLEIIGDVRFNGSISPTWIRDIIRPSRIERKARVRAYSKRT